MIVTLRFTQPNPNSNTAGICTIDACISAYEQKAGRATFLFLFETLANKLNNLVSKRFFSSTPDIATPCLLHYKQEFYIKTTGVKTENSHQLGAQGVFNKAVAIIKTYCHAKA